MNRHPQHSDQIQAWLHLRGAEGIGPKTFSALLDHFGSPQQALKASITTLTQITGLGPASASKIIASRNRFDADQELALADRLGVTLLHRQDPRYPAALNTIYDPPPILYVKGTLQRKHALAIALVGSRRSSIYGQEQAAKLAYQLGAAGFTIVSGMARGIDTAAHQGALSVGAQTLAVQGCGLARLFPPENKLLFDKIALQGACLSEFPLTYAPLPQNFPARNRIITGLSLGTVIVEAAPRSGALITARCALEQNREVLAVPGHIDSPLSQGPHQLLKQGATLVTCAQDVVTALGHIGQQIENHVDEVLEKTPIPASCQEPDRPLSLSPEEQQIFQQLNSEPQHTDQLVNSTLLPAGRITASLVSLQIKGLVRSLPGNLFVKR